MNRLRTGCGWVLVAAVALGVCSPAAAVPTVEAWRLPVGQEQAIWMNVEGAYDYNFVVAADGDPLSPVPSAGLAGVPSFLSAAGGAFTDDVDFGGGGSGFGQAAFSDAAFADPAAALDSGGWVDTGVAVELNPGQSLLLQYTIEPGQPQVFIPVLEALPGDANLDGTVGAEDFFVMSSNWGSTNRTWAEADFSGDGNVGPDDFFSLSANWVSTPFSRPEPMQVPTAAIPEPVTGTLALLGAAGIGVGMMRRRRQQ